MKNKNIYIQGARLGTIKGTLAKSVHCPRNSRMKGDKESSHSLDSESTPQSHEGQQKNGQLLLSDSNKASSKK